MNIYQPCFSSSQVAAAAGMTSANFRMQFQRGNWRFIGKPAEANGYGHLFSVYDALGFALARELIELGIHPGVAFELAMKWAHGGAEVTKQPAAISMFVLHESASGKLVTVPTSEGLAWGDLFPSSAFERAPRLVNLTALHRRVFDALGIKEG